MGVCSASPRVNPVFILQSECGRTVERAVDYERQPGRVSWDSRETQEIVIKQRTVENDISFTSTDP